MARPATGCTSSRAGLALHLCVCRTDSKTMAITLPLVRLHIVPRLQRLENRSISPHPVLDARLTEVEPRGNERALSVCARRLRYIARVHSPRERLFCALEITSLHSTPHPPLTVCVCYLYHSRHPCQWCDPFGAFNINNTYWS